MTEEEIFHAVLTEEDPQMRLRLLDVHCQEDPVLHRRVVAVPVPKVIDFGIAKAMQQRLTDKTLFTHFEQMVGTPLYMAPEQAELSGLDIDTRCDIYALGVLLYEMLTGHTPFNQEELMKAGYDEMRRLIREREPKKPSTLLKTLAAATAATASTVATHR